MIKLFEHNRIAYESAAEMLAVTGKAAIVHPTGTGKSFIGFKLCEEHPDETVCWLSPSEYIFKTQLENLKATGADVPENITFFTYAKLMLMTEAELLQIQPDYIVLDEFHRCGAEMWGKGVQNLLALYPAAPLLGLSATAIRYLDNQRDMADELFDGNVASEMTLGEAIVRGILNPPRYVTTVFAYQKDMEKYRRRVGRLRSKAQRDQAERELEALRRALEKADGLDVIFEKHMVDPRGKYIVFCANAEHMAEMIDKAGEWFHKVDTQPRIYSVYSEDPAASQSFADFKNDHSADHMRLLYCIDALNEGIHVEGVNGVILLRPTVSPIIYKQQIGRALSASKQTNAVIFDVVMNIENLYSIDSVEEEMRVALTYYRSLEDDTEIVNEHFNVIDEVRDCRELFQQLDDTLTTSWDVMYDQAKKYYDLNGNLNVPRRYKTPEGYSLGSWVFTQRKVYHGEQFGVLGQERIARLNAIGMIWDSYGEQSWKTYFAAAKAYRETFGDLKVPTDYVTPSGVVLGSWINNLRTCRKSGKRMRYLTPENIRALDDLGMIWNVPDYQWEMNYNAALRYHREHGTLDMPFGYVDKYGIRLDTWLRNMRRAKQGKFAAYKISEEQVSKLSELGMVWEDKYTMLWEKGFSEAVRYREIFGDLDVPASYRTVDGYKLGGWISDQREKYLAGKMPEARIKRLESIGMIWKKQDPWEVRFALAEAYYKEHGDLQVPSRYTVNGMNLNKWLSEQRQAYLGNRKWTLTADQIRRLDNLGMVWQRKVEKQSA